eukprot:3544050-Rhodomonas_salina.1
MGGLVQRCTVTCTAPGRKGEHGLQALAILFSDLSHLSYGSPTAKLALINFTTVRYTFTALHISIWSPYATYWHTDKRFGAAEGIANAGAPV